MRMRATSRLPSNRSCFSRPWLGASASCREVVPRSPFPLMGSSWWTPTPYWIRSLATSTRPGTAAQYMRERLSGQPTWGFLHRDAGRVRLARLEHGLQRISRASIGGIVQDVVCQRVYLERHTAVEEEPYDLATTPLIDNERKEAFPDAVERRRFFLQNLPHQFDVRLVHGFPPFRVLAHCRRDKQLLVRGKLRQLCVANGPVPSESLDRSLGCPCWLL